MFQLLKVFTLSLILSFMGDKQLTAQGLDISAALEESLKNSDESSNGSGMQISLGADFLILRNVPDFRYLRGTYNDYLGDPLPVPEERYRIFAQNFQFNFSLMQEENYNSALQLWLGFRNAFGGDETSPSGSELSGYRIALKQSLWGARLINTLSYGLMRSDFLRLIAKHHEYRARLDYVPDPSAIDPAVSPFFLRIGPEAIWTLNAEKDSKDDYGFQWAIHVLLRYQTFFWPDLPTSFGTETFFRRIDFYKVKNKRSGGAGIFTISPFVESLIVENLWLGFKVAIPALRPEGREEAFSDPEIPGLFGSGIHIYLKTVSF